MNIQITILLALLLVQNADYFDHEFSWLKQDATIWSVNQTIKGKSIKGQNGNYWLIHNGLKKRLEVNNGEFEISLKLKEIENRFWIMDDRESSIISDTLTLTLGYNPIPILMPVLKHENNQLHLQVETLENPLEEELNLQWEQKKDNPEILVIEKSDSSSATVAIPSIDGDYWITISNQSKFGIHTYKAMFRKNGGNIIIFGADNPDHPWIESAILYQLSPSNFTASQGLKDITSKIPEIAKLGINTLYLQPIFPTYRKGQGYDIVDYFALKEAFGTKEDLEELMTVAKNHRMKVLFDLVINHSSIHHPYAKDRIANRENSHYNDFYHTIHDGAKYSSHYTTDEHGFINYFWDDLVNLNYDNEEVQRWMLEACKYWVNEFDIDGYRFDAIWGVMARKPEFGIRLRKELKSIKPDIFLLAEAKANEPEVYENGYDAAYDWTNDTLWVSQWSWEYEYSTKETKTVFNHPEISKRKELLEKAIFVNEQFANRTLRFTENNDLHRFPNHHSLDQAKLAAVLVFTLPGIPMIYQGQEIAALAHPYTSNPVFETGLSIKEQDSSGMYDFFKDLIEVRLNQPTLTSGDLEPLALKENLMGFVRTNGEERIVVIVNLSDKHSHERLLLNQVITNSSSKNPILENLFNDSSYSSDSGFVDLNLAPYESLVLLVH